MSSHSFSTNTHASENSYFDPPIENYRFYYQGDNSVNDKNSVKNNGFFLKQRKHTKLGSEIHSEYGTNNRMSDVQKPLYGSTFSRDQISCGDGNSMRADDRDL